MAGSIEKEGRSPAAAVASARPPVFFSRRGTVENALRRWGAADAGRIATRLHEAVLQTRRRPDLAEAVTRHTLLAIALDGGRRR
jgi:DNA polymerase-3 subunit delta